MCVCVYMQTTCVDRCVKRSGYECVLVFVCRKYKKGVWIVEVCKEGNGDRMCMGRGAGGEESVGSRVVGCGCV